MSQFTVFGIRQCDTCRKALKWLESEGVEAVFHDLRTDGLDDHMLQRWLRSSFSDQLVNRRSTTWRTLSDAEKTAAGEAMHALLLANPTLVKRPVFEQDGVVIAVGFKPDGLLAALGRNA